MGKAKTLREGRTWTTTSRPKGQGIKGSKEKPRPRLWGALWILIFGISDEGEQGIMCGRVLKEVKGSLEFLETSLGCKKQRLWDQRE